MYCAGNEQSQSICRLSFDLEYSVVGMGTVSVEPSVMYDVMFGKSRVIISIYCPITMVIYVDPLRPKENGQDI